MKVNYDVCCGVDVGKWSHHFLALIPNTGEILMDEKVEQNESAIRSILLSLQKAGTLIVVVDQPGSMAAILFAVARSLDIELGFITPKAMSKAIDMYGGDLKSDAHDALIIAEVAAGLPKLVKPLREKNDIVLELSILMSYDRRLTEDITRTSNRLHDLLLSSCPPLEAQMRGKSIQTALCVRLLERFGGAIGLTSAGRANVRKWVRSKKGFGEAALQKVDVLYEAASSQSVTLPGQKNIESLIKGEATRLIASMEARKKIAERRDMLLGVIPDASILMSLPGLGAVTWRNLYH